MTTETETVLDPALIPEPPAADEIPVTPADPVEPAPQPADPAPDQIPAARMIPQDTFLREVSDLRARHRQAALEADELRRERDAARELLSRVQQGDNPPPADQRQPQQYQQPDQQALEQEIDRRAAARAFQQQAAHISSTGAASYPATWGQAVGVLEALGLNTPDMVGAVMDIAGPQRTHEVMHHIGQDPQMAATLKAMTPARRIAELGRISADLAAKASGETATQREQSRQPAPRTVSRAPAPAPRVEPAASKVVNWRDDKASDEEFNRGFEQDFMQRFAKRGHR